MDKEGSQQKEELRKNITEKTCLNCEKLKKKEEFGIKNDAKDGLQTNCKECVILIKRQWRENKKKK